MTGEITEEFLESFLESYLKTALWSSGIECFSVDEHGEYKFLDELFTEEDISPEARTQCKTDCKKFLDQIKDFQYDGHGLFHSVDYRRIAHDFWLTRNKHGAGFDDGDYEPEIEKVLMKAVEEFKEVDFFWEEQEEQCDNCNSITKKKWLYIFQSE